MKMVEQSFDMQAAEQKLTSQKPQTEWLYPNGGRSGEKLVVNHSLSSRILWAEFEKNKSVAADLFDGQIPAVYESLKLGFR